MSTSTFFKKILVPLGGSALSERPIEPALAIGRQSNSEIVLARAPLIDLNLVIAANLSSDRVHAELHTCLNSLQLTYASPDIQPCAQIIEGDPASAIDIRPPHREGAAQRALLSSMPIIRSPSPELN